MVSALLFGIVLHAQTANVSVEVRGVRLEIAAPALAQALGLESLTVGPSIRNDVLLVRCKDVAPEVLKEKIARAVNATWMHPPEGWRLAQTTDQLAQDKAVFDSERLKKFSKIVSDIQRKAAKMPAMNEATCKTLQQSIMALSKIERTKDNSEQLSKRLEQIDSNTPDERLGLLIASRVTPQMFMKLTKDRPKVVFCNHPTSIQIALPFSVEEVVNQVVRDQDLWIKVAGTNPVKPKPTQVSSGDEEGAMDEYFGGLNANRKPILKESLSNITVTLDLNSEMIEVNAYSDKGEAGASSTIYVTEFADEVSSAINSPEPETFVKEDEAKSAPPKGELKDFLDLIGQNWNRKKPKANNAQLLRKFVQPEKFDPLSYAAPYLALAKIKNPNVVMVLDDQMATPDGFNLGQDPDEVERKTIVETTPEWYISRFLNPIAIREGAVDRKVFGPIVRYLDQNQRELTLEEDAGLAFAEQWNLAPSLVFESIKGLFRAGDTAGIFSRGFDDGEQTGGAKRIYGSLTDGERRRMFGNEVSVGSLSDATRKEIYRAIYFGMSGRRGGGISVNFPDEENLTLEQERLQTMVYGVFRDPTFGVPNGIQSNFTLTLEESTRPTLSVICKIEGNAKIVEMMGDYSPKMQIDAESVGRMMFEFSRPREPRRNQFDGENPLDYRMSIDTENIRMVTSRSLTMKMHLSKWLSVSWNLEGTAWNDPNVYSMKTLPQALQADIQRGYAESEKQYKESKNVVRDEQPPIKKVPPPNR
ncbi:MAG: hypothetical protein WCG75_03305 [Armatimonadota bacterium]